MVNIVAKINYCVLMTRLDKEELRNCKSKVIGAGLGGELNHTSKLHVMKCKKAINESDNKARKQEAVKEDKLIMRHDVWRPVKRFRYLYSVWFMKRKADGTLPSRLTVH